jgi:hypothetical protein
MNSNISLREDEIDVSLPQAIQWLSLASQLPGRGVLAMAVVILQLAVRIQRDDYVLLLPKTLQRTGLSRSSSYRALESLQQAGLINIRRNHGDSPLVTILWPEVSESGHQ